MSKKSVLFIGLVLLVTLFLASNLAVGEKIEDKLSRVIRLKLGLDTEIYRVVETEYQGEKLVLVVIFGSEKAQRSSLGTDIKSGLRRYEDKSPVAISVLTRNRGASFRPYALRIIQDGEISQAKQIIGISDGFKQGKMPEKVPIDGKEFWGSKGIITLGSSFDPTVPFKIKYGTSSASFALASPQKKEPEAIEVTQEQNDETGMNETAESKPSEGKDLNSPPVSSRSSKSGQGLALLAQFGTLLAITLSLL